MHVSVPQPIFGLKLASIDSSTCQEWNRIIKESYRCELAKKINLIELFNKNERILASLNK